MAVLTMVFGRFAKMPSAGVPYPIFVLCALIPWQFFAAAVSECGSSLVGNSALISKVYFPRMTIPASSIITSFVDLMLSGLVLTFMMMWYRFVPDLKVVTLPLFLLMALAAALGIGLWISALMVRYRDFRFIVPFLVQFGLYLSPVGFKSDIVPAEWRTLYALNPMVGVIDGFRWSLLGGATTWHWPSFVVSFGMVVLMLVSGIKYFRHTERTFADVI
jgi:lipopolysaccharide transport system permease protein